MKTVVLMGFSTTGKSSISRLLDNNPKYNELIDFQDSDRFIASQLDPVKPNIYKIYLKYTKISKQDGIIKPDREEVFRFINENAKKFLHSLIDTNSTSKKYRLIAAGPFLHSDNKIEWAEFIIAAKPDFIFLKISPQKAYENLIDRHNKQLANPEICNHLNFGSWDLCVTKTFDSDCFKLLSKEIALNNISGLINSVEPACLDFCRENVFNVADFSSFDTYIDAVKTKILEIFEIK